MTRAKEDKPVRRLTAASRCGDEVVVEVYARRIVLRPKGCRVGGPAEVEIAPAVLYQRLMIARRR